MTVRQTATLLTATISAVAAALIVELSFGSWFSGDGWARARALNIVVGRQVTQDASRLYDDGRPVTYTRDQYGLRGHYGEPAQIRILTIGGSTTDQRWIADGRTWQDELERALRDDGIYAPVANAGVDGHSTFGHLASFRYWFPLVPGLRPAYIVLSVGINDFFVDGPVADFEGGADGRVTLASRIKADSALYRLYTRSLGVVAARRAGLGHERVDARTLAYTEAPNLRGHDALARPRVERFGERMKALLDAVRATGAVPVCVTQPSLYYRRGPAGRIEGVRMTIETLAEGPVNGVDYFHLREIQDARMLAACRSAHAVIIDMAAAPWEPEDFYDLIHMTPAGARTLGRRIAEAMKGLPW